MRRETIPGAIRASRLAPRPGSTCAALLGVALLALVPAVGCDGDEPPPTPSALPGSRADLERWVVYLKGEGPDLTEYKKALKETPEKIPAIVEELRKEAARARASFVQRLATLDARVVDHWYLTNAVTVEVPAGNVETLKLLDSVERIEPDRLLE